MKDESKFDPLAAYAQWFMSRPLMSYPVEQHKSTRVGHFSGVVIHRDDRFQTQLWIADPNCEIPMHTHPNVDSIQLYLCGDLQMFMEGYDGNQLMLRIPPGIKHGAKIGPAGASFLAFQEWFKGEPQSVERDWVGPALGPDHIYDQAA